MDPRIALLFEHLDRLIKSAIEQTIEKEYGGVKLLDYVNAGDDSYLDLLEQGFTSRDDGLLVYGPYDLESVAGKGSQARNDLSLAIEPIVGDNTDELIGFRLSLRDQSTVAAGGLNPFRKPDSGLMKEASEIFFLELGEFSTLEEANNLFTKTVDVNNRTAIVSLVGDKLDEIFPNSTSSIEMALSNKGPVISERIRTTLNRSFAPDYIVKAMELVDKEQYEQYGELLGEIETPDTVEKAEADIVPDNISQLETEFETRPGSQNEDFLDYLKKFLEDNLDNKTGDLLNEILISEDVNGVSYQIKLQKAELFPTNFPDLNTKKGELFIKNYFTVVEQQVLPNGETQIDNFYSLSFDELDGENTGLNILNKKMKEGGLDQIINDYVVEIEADIVPDNISQL
jgi:hypothetical protein